MKKTGIAAMMLSTAIAVSGITVPVCAAPGQTAESAQMQEQPQTETEPAKSISDEDFAKLLDFVKEKWDAGELDNAEDIKAAISEGEKCREPLQVEVISASNTEILFLNISRLFTQSDNNNIAKTLSQKITGNMLTISMHKNLILSNRIFCTSPKTVRSRLLIFLSNESRRVGRSDFTIHYDRQQLADYLNVDRTALSKELSKMRDDGLISFKKNQFSIKSPLHE